MNILQIITREHNRSGSGVQMMQLSIELDRRGHKVTTVYRYHPDSDGEFEPYKSSGVNLLRIPLNSTRFRWRSVPDIGSIRRLIKLGDFDVIHTHSSAVDHVFLAALGIDVPVVSNRGMSAKLNRVKSVKYRSPRVDRTIAVSEDIKRIMLETGDIASEKVDVIYGSVDPDRFSPKLKELARSSVTDNAAAVTREQLNIPDNAYVFGYTGSIGGRKGINFLLEAFATVHRSAAASNQAVYLLLVGISTEQLRASNFAMQSNIAPYIVCAGFQAKPEYHMALFDLFVFPGVRDEGLTGAIREAASMQIPVVSTDNGGNRELIIDQQSGLMVPIRDVSALVTAMQFALSEPAAMDDMAQVAYQMVIDKMTIEQRTNAVEALYQNVIEARRA